MHINQHQHRATCLHLASRSRLPSSPELHYDYACVSCIIIIHPPYPSSIWQFITADTSQININTDLARRLLGTVGLVSFQTKPPLCLSTLPAHTHTDTRCTMPIPPHRHAPTPHTARRTQQAGAGGRSALWASSNKQTNTSPRSVCCCYCMITRNSSISLSVQLAARTKSKSNNKELRTAHESMIVSLHTELSTINMCLGLPSEKRLAYPKHTEPLTSCLPPHL